MTWIPSGSSSTDRFLPPLPVLAHLPPPYSLLFPPPPSVEMEETDSPPTAHKPCLAAKRPLMAPYSEAAKALLSSPLPPELVVDFKGCSATAISPPTVSTPLRNSNSENNVHHMPAESGARRLDGAGFIPACRTLSDGARKSYARRKLESEDSSYDSDYECSDSLSLALTSLSGDLNQSAPGAAQQHEDVSRTVSDTLAAEFSEYVSVYNPPFHRLKEAARDDSGDSDESPPAPANDPSYSSRVEFALKLGYTEQQVQKALVKLGQPTQNELLAELIRLASLAGPTSSEAIETQTDCFRSHRPLSITSSDEAVLRHVVIDGSNVAISHGNKEVFSCRGIQLCVDWFRARGHHEITVFVPMWRKETSKIDAPIANQEILLELEKERMLVFTPSRQVGGRRLVCYDDRYILRLAAETDGIVVSNDNYRDLVSENPEYRKIVEERILMYSFVNDRFMPPEDPLGRNGPKLDRFLRKPPAKGSAEATGPPCPYGKKCTYGNKCKYYHPERGNVPQKTISERLVEQTAHRHLLEVKARNSGQTVARKSGFIRESSPTCKTFSLPLAKEVAGASSGKPPSPVKKTPLARTKSIVPSLTVLPPELIEERPVQDDTNPPEEQANKATILKSRSVENMARLSPVRSAVPAQQQQIPHGLMLHAPPPAFSVPPPPMTMDGFGSSSMNWNRSGHVPLGQQLSDSPSATSSSGLEDADDSARSNPHRKVQRQLTLNPLNPACDPRLYTLKGLAPPYPPPPISVHSIVTRNASAPAPTSQLHTRTHPHLQPTGANNHMQRLNSTSDTQLNLYGATASTSVASAQDWNSQGLTDPFDEWTTSPPPPLPPVQPTQHVHQHSWASRTSSLPAHQHLSSSPLQAFGENGPNSKSEARYKLFYHLAAIFPEEQVRQVMSLMPDETNAQKICAAILALYPKDN